MDAMDIQAVESKLCDVTVTAIPMITNKLSQQPPQPSLHVSLPTAPLTITATSPPPPPPSLTFNSLSHSPLSLTPIDEHLSPAMITTRISADITTPLTSMNSMPSSITNNSGLTKYAQLLAVIEEMGRDIRPTYSGSRSSAERLKRGIVHARILVRDCLLETERSAKQ